MTSISDSTFEGCSRLTGVYITDLGAWCNISFDGYNANPLYYAHNLYINGVLATDITIPNSVTRIGSSAFSGCSRLTSIEIPASVTSIGSSAFDGCSGLTGVYITDLGAWCNISFGNGYANPLYYAGNLYINGILATDITIPNSVTSIGDRVFYGCSSLTSIEIPASLTSIGNYAFSDCSSLTSITVATGNPKYHSDRNCLIETTSKTLIAGCKASVIPTDGSVTSIGEGAFAGCSGLTSIVIPASVTDIGDFAFADCESLTSIEIPASATSIGDSAFRGCSSLESITFDGSKAEWNAISKGSNWNSGTGNCTIHCTDGEIRKN